MNDILFSRIAEIDIKLIYIKKLKKKQLNLIKLIF